jgi:two-component system, cell cycle response regulator
LLVAAIFMVAVVGYHRRSKTTQSVFDRGIYFAAGLNVTCHMVASQSQLAFDAPFALGQTLALTSYAVAVGGALLDYAELFAKVRRLATSDALTGVANFRHLLDVLDSEIRRSERTGRPFAVVMLDLDGFKKINDKYGHLVGNHALFRLATLLRVQCRAIDTAARYGGDEFALVLPETGEATAKRVVARLRSALAGEKEIPRISVSSGFAIYPRDGVTVEDLLSCADRALYDMKTGRRAAPTGTEGLRKIR